MTDYYISVAASAAPPLVSIVSEGGGAPPAFDPSAMTGAFMWLRGADMSGSPIDQWPDQIGSGDATAAGTARPTRTAAGGTWQTDVATFDGTTDMMVSAASAASLRILHDGTGCGIGVLFRPTATNGAGVFLLGTSNGTAANTGLEIWYYLDHLVVQMTNSSGVASFIIDHAGLVTLDANHSVFVRHKTGEANEWEVYFDGVLVDSGDYAHAVDVGDASGALTIGAAPNGLYKLTGDIADVVICAAYPSAEEITELHDFWDSEY